MGICTLSCQVSTLLDNLFQDGLQPIHYAAEGGHLHIVDALISEYGADPNAAVSKRLYRIRHACMRVYSW